MANEDFAGQLGHGCLLTLFVVVILVGLCALGSAYCYAACSVSVCVIGLCILQLVRGAPRFNKVAWGAVIAAVALGGGGVSGWVDRSAKRERDRAEEQARQESDATRQQRLAQLDAIPADSTDKILAACVALGDWWSTVPAAEMARCDGARVAILPTPRISALPLFGKGRADVRRILGNPHEHSNLGTFSFDGYPLGADQEGFVVLYDKDGLVSAIDVHYPEIEKNLRTWRLWLGFDAEGELPSVNGSPLRDEHDANVFTISTAAFSDFRSDLKKVAESLVALQEEKKAKAGMRNVLAKTLEQTMLANGMDAQVRAQGTTLAIGWILCSRPFLYQLVNGTDSMFSEGLDSQITAAGFKKIECYGADGLVTTMTF